MTELNELEKYRLEKIERNKRRMQELGINDLTAQISDSFTTPQPKKKAKPATKNTQYQINSAPVRSSKRLQGLKPDGSASDQIPTIQVISEDAVETTPITVTTPLSIEKDCKGSYNEASWNSLTKSFETEQLKYYKVLQQQQSGEELHGLTLLEEHVQKLTEKGVTVLEFAPLESDSVSILAAADKLGEVAIWKLDKQQSDKNDDIFNYRFHNKFISGLVWSQIKPATLYTCSYDRTVRALNFETKVSTCITSSNDTMFSSFDFDGMNMGIIGTLDGEVRVFDIRAEETVVQKCAVHDRKIGCVNLEPMHSQIFLTCCNDNTVAVWDMRKLQESGKKKNLYEMPHSRTCQSAYFCPGGSKRVLTTCYDDKLRIFSEEGDEMRPIISITHSNNTGRWVTPFRAVWAPSGKQILCGNMKRGADLFTLDYEQNQYEYSLIYESEYMTAIPSRLCVSQGYPIIAAATSSGRVHMFQ
eukprot:TRINITY_DN3634_c0_g1_i4.p1 TRINITY_DN3634_c0_g1~~TRINITY_DN3634_c0_g1_i4.p1  ORF type:complete len:472 (-),score=42.60 TRINITY_DN3634_c0_g1_i4:324-1739(-)